MTDRLTGYPLFVAIVLAALLLTFGYTALNFERLDWLFLLTFAFSLLVFVVGLVLLAICLVRARWRSSISLVVALVLLAGCVMARFELYFQIDRIRFQVFKDYYVRVLASGDSASAGKPTAFRWGLWVHFTTGPIYRLLIHDPSDDVARPGGMRSAGIQRVLEKQIEDLPSCAFSTRRISEHFYSVVAAC
jgi:hypothetical protein